MSLISIIVPVYNVEKYIGRCLDSLLNQTLTDIQIIIVNDGSPDESLKICQAYAVKDKRIQTITKQNGGLSSARNAGLPYVKSEYVMFIDADDWVELNLCEKMYHKAKTTKSDIVMCDYYKDTTQKAFLKEIPIQKEYVEYDAIVDELLYGMIGFEDLTNDDKSVIYPYVWRCMYAIELIKKHELTFVSERKVYAEDIVFNMHAMYLSKRISFCHEPLYHYFYCPTSLSTSYREGLWDKFIELRKILNQFADNHGLMKKFQYKLQMRCMQQAIKSIVNECHSSNSKKASEKINNIKAICNHKEVREAIQRVDYTKLSKMKRLILFCIKQRWAFVIYAYYSMGLKIKERKK